MSSTAQHPYGIYQQFSYNKKTKVTTPGRLVDEEKGTIFAEVSLGDGWHKDEDYEMYTVYVRYMDSGNPKDYDPKSEEDNYSLEEIDVNVLHRNFIKPLVNHLIGTEYEDGGVIHEITHRPRGIMFM